jgi:probable F420-dependent oxidoreductase
VKLGFMVPRETDFIEGQDPYERIYEMCQEAETLGFDFATFTHHRFSPDRPHISQPFVLMSAIAARTKRLKLITTIFILPLYHPLEVAEMVASLDQVSSGRVVLGVGAGYRQYEADAVELPYEQRISRMTESIHVLREAWTKERASFHGRHYNFDDVAVVPKPVQQPRPPIWIGAMEPKPIARAAEIADGWIAPSLQTMPVLQERSARYRELAAAAGNTATICLERDVAVGPDRAAAKQSWITRNEAYIQHFRDHGAPVLPDAERAATASIDDGLAVSGTPEDCVRELERYRDVIGCEYLSTMNLGTGRGYGNAGNYDDELAAMRLFGAEVLPAFLG